jgi:LPXTG-motif cell wall-anchored protein
MNRDGVRDQNEPFLKSTKLSVSSGTTSLTAYTDDNGLYKVSNVAPGTWAIAASLSISELEMVYDTTGAADWKATAIVPVNGVGTANFAAAGKSTIALSLPQSSVSSVIAQWSGSDEKFCSTDDIAFTGTVSKASVKLESVPQGSYRIASDDPCDSSVSYMRASVAKGAKIEVVYAPQLPATGSGHNTLLAIIAFLLLAVGTTSLVSRRRIDG